MNKRKRQDMNLYKPNTTKGTWWQARQRDNDLCVLCGRRASEVHHINFRSAGGTSELDNLACLCVDCHYAAHGVNAKEIKQKLKEIIYDERTN